MSGARCGACGRGRTYPSHSGGLGSPSGPTTGLCHSVAGRVRMTAGESRSDGRAPASFQYPEARSLGQKPSRWHAVRRCAAQVCWRSGRQEQRQKPPSRLAAHRLPSCFEGRPAHTSDAQAPRECRPVTSRKTTGRAGRSIARSCRCSVVALLLALARGRPLVIGRLRRISERRIGEAGEAETRRRVRALPVVRIAAIVVTIQ